MRGEAFKIDWSRARNDFAFPKGDYPSWFIPAAYRRPNMVFIITQSSYRYNSVLPNYFDTITFFGDIFLIVSGKLTTSGVLLTIQWVCETTSHGHDYGFVLNIRRHNANNFFRHVMRPPFRLFDVPFQPEWF